MKIYVGGINASGKSTLLKEVAKKLGYSYIHATTGLLESLGFGKDYEKLRALKQAERDITYAQYIDGILNKENFLLDAHYLGLVRGKTDIVTGEWIKNFDAFILISAPFDDVWIRIENDAKERDRALFPSENNIDENKEILLCFQNNTQQEFLRLARLYKKPYIEIINKNYQLENGVERLVRFIADSTHQSS